MRSKIVIVVARVRVPVTLAAIAVILANIVAGFFGPVPVLHSLLLPTFVIFAAGLAASILPAAAIRREPVEVRPPVLGRWLALNGPAARVPSHGLHAYGQSYAIDLVYQPDPGQTWSGARSWPVAAAPDSFAGFGQPVVAPADGVVVKVSDWQRDHWSRNSWLGAIFVLLIEGSLRELTGPGRVLGNHVVLDLGDGVYAALAHLKHRSAVVVQGQRVRTGERLASCGNSGNSTEPHLHFQLMDRPGLLTGAGLPFRFDSFETGGEVRSGVPANRQPFTVTQPA